MVFISFVKTTDGASKQNLDQLDQSFMYTQILKEILITIDFEEEHFREFLAYCRKQFVGNSAELKNVVKIEKKYHHHQPSWWYTYDCFLYSMLNCALRTTEVPLIIRMGFFVRDLHQHIVLLHSEQFAGENHSASFTAYRGQGLCQTDFDQMMNTQGGLLSFNNFLSTSLDRAVSLAFAKSNQYNPDLRGVLFQITIDPQIPSTAYANISSVSAYQTEEEILFSTHSVFRIRHMEPIDGNNRLWQVQLTLTSDNDPELHALTERMREETKGLTAWLRLGKLMLKLARYKEAENLYDTLLAQTTDERDKGDIFYQPGYIKFCQEEYTQAITFYENSLKIRQKVLTWEHSDVGECYNDIGNVYDNIGEYPKALSYYKKALEIWQKTLPPFHSLLATSHSNIGGVYLHMGEYLKALSYYEKALEIKNKTLPANHPHLTTSYNNIGSVYDNMGEYSKALASHEKALEIRQETLLPNHPDLATSYACHGSVCDRVGDYSKALSYYERALDILQRSIPATHPHLQSVRESIETVKMKL